MAKIHILKDVKIMSNIKGLMDVKFLVDIDIVTLDCFNSLIESGFDPKSWEEKNKNKVFINGKHYTEY